MNDYLIIGALVFISYTIVKSETYNKMVSDNEYIAYGFYGSMMLAFSYFKYPEIYLSERIKFILPFLVLKYLIVHKYIFKCEEK